MESEKEPWVPNGHFYSPVPSTDFINSINFQQFTMRRIEDMQSIELQISKQKKLIRKIAKKKTCLEFPDHFSKESLYHYENPFFSYGDAGALLCMILENKPNLIIEVGSGYSTALMIEVRKKLDLKFKILCIEPYPEILHNLIDGNILKDFEILPTNIQDIEISHFDKLNDGDVLFIDSTHVSKFGSDVNFIFEKILPRLKKGVIVHFHDIFWPFEYPESWVLEGRAWNEAYVLRAFLQYNRAFEIFFWPHMMDALHPGIIDEIIPKFKLNKGASIYIRRI